LKAILVDDEQIALDFLENLLIKTSELQIVAKLTNPLLVKDTVKKTKSDIVFLDINMPQVNGLELAEQILEINPDIHIVFVTAYDEYAINAFEINALDYLLKPIRIDRLQKTMERLKNNVVLQSFPNKVETKSLQLNVCGNFSITNINDEIEIISWRTAKVKELFLYLLHKREKLVRKSWLIELLWSDLEPERAYAQLYTAIYHVRKTLKKYPGFFKLENTTEGYILSTKNVVINLELWKEKIYSASPISSDNIQLCIEAMEFYTAPYFDEYDYWWAESEKNRYEKIWLDTSLKIAEFYFSSGQYEDAKDWYLKITTHYPELEQAHFALMKLFSFTNDNVNVQHQYEKLKEILKYELGTVPEAMITNWYAQWRKYNM
jgi:two-component system, LytTR family, response regulator